MKKWICVLLVVLFASLTGCSAHTQETVFAMDTVMDLQVWGKDGREAVAQLKVLLTDLEKTWSAQNPDSLLSQMNNTEDPTHPLLEQVLLLSEQTGGAFDPQLGAVMELWGFRSKEYTVPTTEQLAQALQEKTWDLGGAVKGYAGQRAVQLLESLDIDRAILNLGGNIQTYGTKSDGKPWVIGIQDPDGEAYLGTVSVAGTAAVVTSGDYQRYFERDGVRYHHILDPKTGMPAQSGLRSVTVICRDGLTADVLSTALFVMGLEDASAFWRQSGSFEAVFVTDDGKIYATAGADLSGCAYEVIPQ